MPKFTGTLLPQTANNNDPKDVEREIQKGNLDLLSKINDVAGNTPITGTAAEMAKNNARILAGQMAFETDTGFFKIGTDGKTQYNALPYQWKVPYFSAAPLPQSAAGAGQWLLENSGSGAGYNLPAGGTWAWFQLRFVDATGGVAYAGITAGVAAGGSNIAGAVAGNTYFGIVWRIS
jgi:hypothetical protein